MPSIALDPLHEITALAKLHDYHQLISTLNCVIDIDNMWVLQLSLQMNLRDNKDAITLTSMHTGRTSEKVLYC